MQLEDVQRVDLPGPAVADAGPRPGDVVASAA